MATKRWVGGAGSYTDPAAWSPGGVPGALDTAVLGAGASVTVGMGTPLGAIVLTDPTTSLIVQGVTGLVSAAPTLTAVTGGGSLTGQPVSPGGMFPPISEFAGTLLIGSPNPATPFRIVASGGTFNVAATVEVVGAVAGSGTGAGTFSDSTSLSGPVLVEPGGTLTATGSFYVSSATIAHGTLDLSQVFGGLSTVTFDGGGGSLVISNGTVITVASFRAGDQIDIKNLSLSGPLSPSTFVAGCYQAGSSFLQFTGPTAAGATYTARPDGSGGTDVTVQGANAGPAPASQYIFGFNLTDARIAYTAQDHAILTATNGTVTDVTGVASLQFLDGTVQTRPSSLVDPLFYYARNPDVWAAHLATGLTAEQHYAQYGWYEGRDPDALFSTRGYLAANPDVAAAGVNPATHYDQFGWHEGRAGVAFSPEAYRAANADVSAAGVDPLAQFLSDGAAQGRYAFADLNVNTIGLFDSAYYLSHNPDVAAAVPVGTAAAEFALTHFLTFGWTEGRDPDALFSTRYYLAQNPDVARAGLDPLLHYEQYGWHEGRNPSTAFNTAGYLQHNPDVTAAGLNPLQHYLQYGIGAGRAPG